jgi:3-oxoacyl-[acyl-carrier protein] reductase
MKRDVSLITGGARGLGLGIAIESARRGLDVAIFDLDDNAMKSGLAEIAAANPEIKAKGYRIDVSSQKEVNEGVAEVTREFGSIDILVNNAGRIRDKAFMKLTLDDWDVVMETNLKALFLTCQAAIPGMQERGFGRIVNISSRAWLGGVGQANYSAAKGGVVSLTRTLALEYAAHGITVNAIAPGIMQTPMFESFKPHVQERLQKSVPMQKIGKPNDVAHAVLFFASRENAYVTGQLLYVCGGRSLFSPSV